MRTFYKYFIRKFHQTYTLIHNKIINDSILCISLPFTNDITYIYMVYFTCCSHSLTKQEVSHIFRAFFSRSTINIWFAHRCERICAPQAQQA